MDLSLFDYNLPEGYFAYRPARQRDQSKLMILNRADSGLSHHNFPEIVDYFNEGDALVVNVLGPIRRVVLTPR